MRLSLFVSSQHVRNTSFCVGDASHTPFTCTFLLYSRAVHIQADTQVLQNEHARALSGRLPPAEPSDARCERARQRAAPSGRQQARKARSRLAGTRVPTHVRSGIVTCQSDLSKSPEVKHLSQTPVKVTWHSHLPNELAMGVRLGASGVLGWRLEAVRTVSSALVQALDDETTADADELGGQAPAGKTSAARAVHVVALAPPATQGGDTETPLPTPQRVSRRGLSTCRRFDSRRPRRRRRGRRPASARRPWSTHGPERSCTRGARPPRPRATQEARESPAEGCAKASERSKERMRARGMGGGGSIATAQTAS